MSDPSDTVARPSAPVARKVVAPERDAVPRDALDRLTKRAKTERRGRVTWKVARAIARAWLRGERPTHKTPVVTGRVT